jgi:hypothetical protein
MALFLEEVEKALAAVVYPVGYVRKLETALLVFFEDFLKGYLGSKKSPDHFEDLLLPDPLRFPLHFGLPSRLILTSLPLFVKSFIPANPVSPLPSYSPLS